MKHDKMKHNKNQKYLDGPKQRRAEQTEYRLKPDQTGMKQERTEQRREGQHVLSAAELQGKNHTRELLSITALSVHACVCVCVCVCV